MATFDRTNTTPATLTLIGADDAPIVLAVPATGLVIPFPDGGLQCQADADVVAALSTGGAAVVGTVLLMASL